MEKFLLREFRRRYHHYSQVTPDEENVVEWLSIMQHYGAPTRLLDWTYSLPVATYFEASEAQGESAVWCINASWCNERAIENARWNREDRKFVTGILAEDDMVRWSKLLMSKTDTRFVYPMTPTRLNPRLSVQQGTFLWHSDMTRSFEENLSSMRGYDRDDNVMKLVIPIHVGEDALRELYRVNVTHASLFPGLDGFARSLGISVLALRPDWVKWERRR